MITPSPECVELYLQGARALAWIEHNGVRIDEARLDKTVAWAAAEIASSIAQVKADPLWAEWRKKFGASAKINSGPQLAWLVYDHLGHAPRAFTDTGAPSTEESAFESVDLPFLDLLFRVKKLKKLQETYLHGLKNELCNGFLHPFFHVHTTTTGRSCIAKGTMIEVVRDLSQSRKGIPIEDVRVGDHVYCYDADRKLVIRKVLWAGKTGRKQVVRVHWISSYKTGYTDMTPDHRIRMVSGEYVAVGDLDLSGDYRPAEASRHTAKVGCLAMSRKGDMVLATGQDYVHDHRLIYRNLLGHLPDNEVVHHKDGNHYNNLPDNLQRMTKTDHARHHEPALLRPEVRAKALQSRLQNLKIFGPNSPPWDENPLALKLTKWQVLKMLALAGGKSARVGASFVAFKRYATKYGINLRIVKIRYDRDGRYVSIGRLRRLHQMGREAIRQDLKVNFYKIKEILEDRGLDTGRRWANQLGPFTPGNHVIVGVEHLPDPVDVYDIEVEEHHNFIANEICVHNSSKSINFQNIPVRDQELGKVVRDCVVPRKGRVLAETDFSTLEFLVAACVWGDPGMLAYASDPSLDIHRDFAAVCYGCEPAQVSKMMRSIAKNQFVFPVLYGSYYISCARGLWESVDKFSLALADGTPLKKHLAGRGVNSLGACDPRSRPRQGTFEFLTKAAEDHFYKSFSTFAERREKRWNDYLKKGGYRTVHGFACNGEVSRNFFQNSLVQSPAFGCLLQSLIWLCDWLRDERKKTLVVAQIHDCILKDTVVSELQEVLDATEHFMTVKLRQHWGWIAVPFRVEVDVTPVDGTWAEKAPWVKKGGKWGPK